MAAIAAIHSALGRLGFTGATQTFTTDAQGLDTLEEFRILTDSEVESLVKVIRRPGGTVAGAAPAAAPDPRIPNPGIAVSLRAENNLKLACYYLRHKHKTSRTVNANDITLTNVRALHDFKEWEDTQDDPSALELTAQPDWLKAFEAIQEWLKSCLGVPKIPLAYVIRANEDMQPKAADPPEGYDSVQEEIIARAKFWTRQEITQQPSSRIANGCGRKSLRSRGTMTAGPISGQLNTAAMGIRHTSVSMTIISVRTMWTLCLPGLRAGWRRQRSAGRNASGTSRNTLKCMPINMPYLRG